MTLSSAMRCFLFCIVFSVFAPAGLNAQTLSPSSTPQRSLETILEEMVRDEWVPTDRDPGWLVLQRRMNEELTQRPHEPLAALIRRAAAYVDVEASRIVVRRSRELTISLQAQPRFSLEAPIPYVAQIHASIDGGEWFQLGRLRDGSGCCTSSNIVSSKVATGVHRMQLAADVSFFRESTSGSDEHQCEIAGARNAATGGTLDPKPENVIQRERRALPAVSFGIFPDLLGAPAVLAHTLETGLPETPLAQWLESVFNGVPEAHPISKESWTVDFCRPEESSVFMGPWLGGWRRRPLAARRQPRDVCADFGVALPDNRMLSLRLRLGTVHEDAGTWSLDAPTFHDLSLGGSGNVMDVAYLGLLPRVLTMPAGAFPRLDMSVDAREIGYEPADAKPGDPIIITAVLRNVGGRDAPFTSGFIGLETITPITPVVARPFVVEIPLDSSASVSFRTTMPASGTIVVQFLPVPDVRLFRQGPYSQLLDVESANNLATKPIGRPKP